ncbi:Notchless protein-like protein 1 [Camelus dromedarius]|uniref:Notchless protein-like protein 1 n=1 Tax=Camelus dromedarius TaxID=9838 RepID=A0A5N4D232_CAMDR|nr:Notchless protein-like protein 1 [Camelus dromedarius]
MALALGEESPFARGASSLLFNCSFIQQLAEVFLQCARCHSALGIKTGVVPLSPSPAFLGHRHWVLSISWSPDGKKLASGCKNGQILLWDPSTGKQVGRTLAGHSKWITALSWEPLHA